MSWTRTSAASPAWSEVAKQNIGVLAMKSMGDGVILKSKSVSAVECLHFAMSQPVSVVITGIDSMPILDQAIDAAGTFKPLKNEEISALLSKTVKAAAAGEYELFKTTSHFDSTAQHP